MSLLLSQKANPDIPLLFNLKRLQEKAFLNLKFSPRDQVEYMSSLLNARLEELSNVVKNKNYDYVLPSASRYSTTAGQITELIIANNLRDKVEDTKNQFLAQLQVLQEIYVIYPKNFDNEEYKYIEDDINYLNLYLDKLSKIK